MNPSEDQALRAVAERWLLALVSDNRSSLMELLSEEAVLVHHLSSQYEFEGADQVATVLLASRACLEDINLAQLTVSEGSAVLLVNAKIKGKPMQEFHQLHITGDGRVRRVVLAGRPLSAMLWLMTELSPKLVEAGVLPRALRLLSMFGPAARTVQTVEDQLLTRLQPPSR